MPVNSIDKSTETLTMTVTADFKASLVRLWNAHLDPRQIERFWGVLSCQATFLRHDAAVGGRSVYVMRGPDGKAVRRYWDWIAIEPGQGFEVRDGLACGYGTPYFKIPSMRIVFNFESTATGSRLVITIHFNNVEEFERLPTVGAYALMAQIDDVLADLTSFATSISTYTQILSDTEVRVSRVIRGSVELVWRAHTEAALMRRWLLGPDGCLMSVCDVATVIGDSYKYEWTRLDGSDGFGFTGELLESDFPYRMVTTESMIGMEGPGTRNELTLTPLESGTLLSLLIVYPNAELRDIVLATGMTDGMETSYARLEGLAAIL